MSNFKVRVSPSFWVVSFITHLSCLKLTIFTSCWLDVVFLFCNKGCWNLRAVVPCNSEKWPLKTLSYSYNKKLSFELLKPFSMVPVLAWVLISVLMNYQVLSNCSFSKVSGCHFGVPLRKTKMASPYLVAIFQQNFSSNFLLVKNHTYTLYDWLCVSLVSSLVLN